MSELSCDIKCVYRASTGHRFVLVIADEATNCLVAVHVYRGTSYGIGEALKSYAFYKHGPPVI